MTTKQLNSVFLTCIIALGLSWPGLAAEPEPKAELDDAFTAAATYESGQGSEAFRRIEEAVRRPLMLVGGLMLNTELSPAEREALYKYVERGGVLLATQVQGNRFFPLFGIARATASRLNFQVRFAPADDPSLRYLNRPEEKVISLGNPDLYSETVWSTEYAVIPGTDVLARYENGAAAVTRYAYGRGLAYALGLGF